MECEFYRTVAMEGETAFIGRLVTPEKVYREGVLKFEIDMNKIQRLDFYNAEPVTFNPQAGEEPSINDQYK